MVDRPVANSNDLSAAWTAANAGDTITHTADFTINSKISVTNKDNVKWSGNNHTLTSGIGGDYIITFDGDSDNNTIKDLIITSDQSGCKFTYINGDSYTIDNVTLHNMYQGIDLKTSVNSVVQNSLAYTDPDKRSLLEDRLGYFVAAESKIEVDNCVVSSACKGVSCTAMAGRDTVNVHDCKFKNCGDGIQVLGDTHNFTSNGNTFNGCLVAICQGGDSANSGSTITSNTFINCGKSFENYNGAGSITATNNILKHTIAEHIFSGAHFSNYSPSVSDEVTLYYNAYKLDNKTEDTAASYTFKVYPTETVKSGNNGSLISGTFNVSREGFYSVLAEVIDSDNNRYVRKFTLLTNDSQQISSNLYYYSVSSAEVAAGNRRSHDSIDFGSIRSIWQPTDNKVFCGSFINAVLDETPDSYIGYISSATSDLIRSTGNFPDTAAQFTLTRVSDDFSNAHRPNISLPITKTSNDIVHESFYHGIPNWTMDYPHSWNCLNIFWNNVGNNVKIWISGAVNSPPSTSTITLSSQVSTKPLINNISNNDAYILSATCPDGVTNESMIEISGSVTTNVVFTMPDTTKTYDVNFDDVEASNVTQSNGRVTVSDLSLSGYHHLDITEGSQSSTPTLAFTGVGRLVFTGGNKELKFIDV